MNSFSPDDFGDTSDLLRALGLVDEGGAFNGDWLGSPGDYLKKMLANEGQRNALLGFVASTQGGQSELDSEDRLWIELFAEPLGGGATIRFYIVVDPSPATEVHLFLGVRFQTAAPLTPSQSSIMFPLFRAAKEGHTVASPELLGHAGGFIALTTEVTISSAPAAPGEAGLQAVGLRLLVPTATPASLPSVDLTLNGLQLPGESTGRNLVLSLSDPASLHHAGLELLFGLLQAQADSAAGVQIRAFTKLFGLANDPTIPNLPVEDIFTRGLDALVDWLASALDDSARRTAWLQALAELLGNGAIVNSGSVVLPVGTASLRLGLQADVATSGRPVITISSAFGFGDAVASVAIAADLVRIDLGTGAAVAVPSLRAESRFDLSGLAMPNMSVDAMVVGFGLNEARRPVLVVELLNAVIFNTTHPRLDLTNPDALAATAAQAVTDALTEVLGNLGPAGDLIAVALGWQPPGGASGGYPRIDLLEFLGDPIGLLRAHWHDVVTNHTGDVIAVLDDLRELITGDATPGSVIGAGTDTSPWQLPLVAGLHVAVWLDSNGKLLIGLAFARSVDTLGERCTVIETRVRAAIVALDLDNGAAGFLPEVSVRVLGRARGSGRLSTNQGALRFELDYLGLNAHWTPNDGLSVVHEAPNLDVFVDGMDVPIRIPDFSGDFDDILASFTDDQWDAVERLISFMTRLLDVKWLDDLIEAVGWARRAPVLGAPRKHRLRLARLVENSEAELRVWLARLLSDGTHQLREQLQPIARFLSGRPDASFHVEGQGTTADPWRIDLASGAGLPKIAAWRQPDAPLPIPDALRVGVLRQWRPGDVGLQIGQLAESVLDEFPDLSGPFSAGLARADFISGLAGVAERWHGSDGRVAPPSITVPGATVHLVQNQSAGLLYDGFDLAAVLGAATATRVQITVLAESAGIDAGLDPARVLDLREPGRDPLAFTPLPAGPGVWHILLAPRCDAALASGDPDGVNGQVARLKHGLSLIATRADVTVITDAAAGHAAWRALHDMGSGLNTLVTIGMPVSDDQLGSPLAPAPGEVLRRLAEFIPEPDPADPDDLDLARGRDVLAAYLSGAVDPATDFALPAGWTGAKRGDLDLHLVYGVLSENAVNAALSAICAAGLSLHAQARSVAREVQEISSASLGAWVPLSSAPGRTGVVVEGHVLGELVGLDIDLTGSTPDIDPRDARAIVGALELRHSDGWLIGGPAAGPLPLDLELRSLEIDLHLTIGGTPDAARNRCRITLHGVRIHDRSFPRLVLSPDLSVEDLGIDGMAAPTTPEIRQLLNAALQDLSTAADPALQRLSDALLAFGVLDDGGTLDATSLSNWMDDPAARLRDVLANSALRARLMALIGDLTSPHAGITFDPASGSISLGLTASTGLPVFEEWSLSATAGAGGVTGAGLRLGADTATRLVVDLVPFSAALHFGDDQAAALGGLPETVPIWPAPDLARLARPAIPSLVATGLSTVLNGLRHSDVGVRPVIDAALSAFGLLDTSGTAPRAVVPPQMFLNPGKWLRTGTVLGTVDGASVRPERVIALIDALKPLVGLSGPSGVWNIAPGVALRAQNDGGLLLQMALDPGAFMPGADVDIGGAVGLRIKASGQVSPALSMFVGLSGGTAGNSAVHVQVAGSDVQVFLRDGAASEFAIYPNAGSLAQLATVGVSAALPLALDAIVATNSPAGHLVGDIGDALLLRQGGNFHGPTMVGWVSDPAGNLETRWPQLLASGLSRLSPALPAGITLTSPGTGIRLQVDNAGLPGSVISVEFNASPVWVEFHAGFTVIPFVGVVDATLRFDQTGLSALAAQVGPANIPLADGLQLRPVMMLDVGQAVGNPSVSVGLAVDTANTNALALRYEFNTESFELGFGTNSPADIASGIMTFAVDLLGSFLLDLPEINTVLDQSVGSSDIRAVLSDVVLNSTGTALDSELFRVVPRIGESTQQLVNSKLDRVIVLLRNIAAADPTVTVGGVIEIGLTETGGSIGFSLGVAGRLAITEGDIAIWIENDSRWIIGGPDPGLKIGLLRQDGPNWEFAPALSVDGVGIRVGRSNAPLLDSPISLGSVALHIFARVSQGEKLGGVQVQLAEIAVAVGGGETEGSNPVAGGMLAETNEGDAALAPGFSPALSVQTRPAPESGIAFGFSAGDGEGPWWLPIRSQFGPLYVDQIGLGTQVSDDTLQSISVLFDGNISIAGLQAAVDDLELRYRLDRGGIFDSSSWEVDLAGLAVSADMSGVTLAGGLRKFGTAPNLEYIGMLSARFATYGLSIYGGYAAIQEPENYSAFFAFGAVLGPFGGPPAFFLTGVGGGFGINREIVPPTDMARFDEFVMISALDPSFDPPGDLMGYMEEVRNTFPPKRGNFWFAAGISFTSFALVDGVAVVAVEFGQGFELSIFGLARMALPRPQVALVSIELGLMARFSTDEGVIWVQAQLTDNSWLLHQSARLTGGFAYVSWFKGDKAGQFVLTLGGYHPNFHRDGYPVVPRLGFNWSVASNIVIKAEVYFALTSEAVMAGGLFEASATFGPAFAYLSFGGNAIVYFDPFRYEADAHARVSAGIRIKTFLGTIKLSFSLGAYLEVAGPEFHGTARVEVGPIDVTVRFGDSSPVPAALISWGDFVEKYLELAPANRASALSGIAGRGALPPASTGAGSEPGTADGSPSHPFDVASEFELSFTSTIPLTKILREAANVALSLPTPTLGLSPVGTSVTSSILTLTLRKAGGGSNLLDDPEQIFVTPRETGNFPIGVWGLPQDLDSKKIPKGDVIPATEGVDLQFVSKPIGKIPEGATGGVSFNQIEPGKRKPLPLRAAGSIRRRLVTEAKAQRLLLKSIDQLVMPQIAGDWQRPNRSSTATRSWLRQRAAPMRVGLLSERIVGTTSQGRKKPFKGPDILVIGRAKYGKAKLRGLMFQPTRAAQQDTFASGTRVTAATRGSQKLTRVAPPTMAMQSGSAVLLRAKVQSPIIGKTLAADDVVPETIASHLPASAARTHSGAGDGARIGAIEAMLSGETAPAAGRRGRRRNAGASTPLGAGDIAVFDLPGSKNGAQFKSAGQLSVSGDARLAVIGLDGRIIQNFAKAGKRTLPANSRAFALLAGSQPAQNEISGWFETTLLGYLGYSIARCRGGFVRAEGASRARGGRKAGTGWMQARELTDQSAVVETTFDTGAQSVAILLEGSVGATDLEDFAISFDTVATVNDKPQLVPFDGKTLVVYTLRARDQNTPFAVTLAGRVGDRLDGVVGAKLPPEALISRLVNGAVRLDLEAYASKGRTGVSAIWKEPVNTETGGN